MVLPAKHLRFAESMLGLGALVLQDLAEPREVDELWILHKTTVSELGYIPSIEKLLLAIAFLYSLGAIDIDAEGRLST